MVAYDSSQLLGAQQVAGAVVLPRGHGDGGRWEFEVPPMVSGPVKRVAEALSF